MTPTFADLVAPLSVEQFLRDIWPDEVLIERDRRRLDVFCVQRLSSTSELLEAYSRSVSLLSPHEPRRQADSGKEALRWYEAGYTCYLRSVEAVVPELQALVADLAETIGVPVGAVTCEAFCSRGSSGVAMHSDFDINFAVLLSGRKRWRLAPNTHIRNQTSVCLSGDQAQRDPRQLELADRLPFPEAMPEDCLVADMLPGSLLFMPRGWWHETEAAGDCLQVNLAVKGPDRLSVLTDGLRGILVSYPQWREFADGIAGDGDRRERALAGLAALLPTVREVLRGDDLEVAERLADALTGE